MVRQNTITLTASDISGQKTVSVSDIPVTHSIGEMIDDLIPKMNLNSVDRSGQRIPFDALLERDGRNLRRSEIISDALQDADHIVLAPRIMAGGSRAQMPLVRPAPCNRIANGLQ